MATKKPQQKVAETAAVVQTPPTTALAVNGEIDFSNFDLTSIEVDQDELSKDEDRKAGLNSGDDNKLKGWFSPYTGRQVIQLVPYVYEVSQAGIPKFEFATGYHAHIAKAYNADYDRHDKTVFFRDANPQLADAMRQELPGYHVPCIKANDGQPCPICKLKWDVGKFYKENTAEGWKHDDIKNAGFYTTFRAIGYVVVKSSAGAWLQTSEGSTWAQKQFAALRGKKNASGQMAQDLFKRGKEEAISAEEEGMFAEPRLLRWVMTEKMYTQLLNIAREPLNNLVNPVKGTPLIVTTTVDPTTGYRETSIQAAPIQVPLVGDAENPDTDAIRRLLSEAKNLRLYRAPWSPAVRLAVEQQCAILRDKLLDNRDMYSDQPDDGVKHDPTRMIAPTTPASSTNMDDLNDSDIPFDDASTTRGAVEAITQPTSKLGANKKPACFRKGVHDANNALCEVCPHEAACTRK